jgi:dihydroorotate dehydrogenase
MNPENDKLWKMACSGKQDFHIYATWLVENISCPRRDQLFDILKRERKRRKQFMTELEIKCNAPTKS